MNEREKAALAALDDRARHAASSLKTAAAVATGDRDLSKRVAGEPSEPSGNGALPKAGVVGAQSGVLDTERIDEIVVEAAVVGNLGPSRADVYVVGDDEVVVDEIIVHDRGDPGEPDEASGDRVTLGARPVWLAAAAVFVMAFAGAAVVVANERGDGRTVEPTTDVGPHQFLVPGWLPDGWEAVEDARLSDGEDGFTPDVPEGEVVAYGDTSLDDPWGGPVLTAERYEAAPDDVWKSRESEQITMLGVPGLLREEGDVVTAEPTVPVDHEHQVVTGHGLARDAVREAAESLTRRLEIGGDSLPDGYEEIARGPVSAMLPFVSTPSDGSTVVYDEPCRPPECSSDPTGSGRVSTSSLVLSQQPANDPRAAAVIRTIALHAELGYEDDVTEVRGQPAYVLHGAGGYWTATAEDESSADGYESPDEPDLDSDLDRRPNDLMMTHVQWFEPSVGMVVTVSTSSALDEDELDRFVDSLRVAD